MNVKILVADDDDLLRNLLCEVLEEQNYSVVEACDGQEALNCFYDDKEISLIILDVMMPQIDGIDVLKEIRQFSDVPVIMLTALGDSGSELSGLRNGANDYVTKPFHYEILLERIKNLLKLTNVTGIRKDVFEHLIVDYDSYKVFVDDTEVVLNNKEFQLLTYLIQNRGIVLQRDRILDFVWGYDYEGDIRTIDTHIKMLRASLGEAGNYIKTIRGVGYVFEVEI